MSFQLKARLHFWILVFVWEWQEHVIENVIDLLCPRDAPISVDFGLCVSEDREFFFFQELDISKLIQMVYLTLAHRNEWYSV